MDEVVVSKPESTTLKDLYADLALAQGEMEIAREREYTAAKGAYPRMADIVVASRPALTKYGLAVNQYYYTDEEGRDFLRTELLHKSGHKLEATMRFSYPKDDLDAWQSALDRFKREQYKAIIGCVSDVDDDGLKAMNTYYDKVARGTSLEVKDEEVPVKPQAARDSTDFITQQQLDELNYELEKYPDMIPGIYRKWKVNRLADIRQSQYRAVVTEVRDKKLLRDGLKSP